MTDICSPTILQARVWNLSWNQDCWQGCTQPESLGEDPCFASFSVWWLPALSDLWPHHPSLCLCCHAVSFSSVSASNCPPPPFFVRMCVIALTAHPNNPRWSPNLKILNLIPSVKTPILFQTRWNVQVPGQNLISGHSYSAYDIQSFWMKILHVLLLFGPGELCFWLQTTATLTLMQRSLECLTIVPSLQVLSLNHTAISSENLCCCYWVTELCPTLCDPMDCSTPGFCVLHYLLQLAQTHVHQVSDAIQPSHPLSSPSPLPSVFPSIRVFSNELALCIRWPKLLELQYWSWKFMAQVNLTWKSRFPRRIIVWGF